MQEVAHEADVHTAGAVQSDCDERQSDSPEQVFLLKTMMIEFISKIYLDNCECKEWLKIVRAPYEKADEENKE